MLRTSSLLLAASALLAGGTALAQVPAATPVAVPVPVPPTSQIPTGTQLPVVPLANGLHVPSKVQVVNPINGVATPATEGALGADGLPSVGTASIGNVAGLLSYCVRHHDVFGTTARVTGRKLAKKKIVQTDPGYSIGGQGLLQNGTSTPFDLSSLSKSKQTAVCSQLVARGQTLSH